MQTIPVKEFLENMGLMQYFDMFIIKGFDHEKDIVTLDEDDLDAMLISDPDHRHQILQAAAQYRSSEKYRLLDWLQGKGLEYYYVSFIQSEVTSLNDVRNLTVDENLFDELEITLPGHKKRLRKAVAQLQREERGEPPTEDVLACGRWKKPDTLQDAKFDFLVTDACIYSTKDPSKYHRIEFMIDTGSDVTTIRQEVLDELGLEILGRIHSKGVHGSKTTNLAKKLVHWDIPGFRSRYKLGTGKELGPEAEKDEASVCRFVPGYHISMCACSEHMSSHWCRLYIQQGSRKASNKQ